VKGVCVLVFGGRAPLEQLRRFENSRNVEMSKLPWRLSHRGTLARYDNSQNFKMCSTKHG
jgi:hypothetical protein